MARSFREIGKRTEALLEAGQRADREVQACQLRVSAASSRVAAARAQLLAASETGEDGEPRGDPARAQAALSVAQGQLAASQRALAAAQSAAGQVRQEKQEQIRDLEQHNRTARENLRKLEQLRSGAFGGDSEAMIRGMAERFNQAEEARATLLRSMGIEARAEHVPLSPEGAARSDWSAARLAALDLPEPGAGRPADGGGQLPLPPVQPAPSAGGSTGPVQTPAQRWQNGLRFIDRMLDVYRENLINRGVEPGEGLENALAHLQGQMLSELSRDIAGEPSRLDDTPDYEMLADWARAYDAAFPPAYVISPAKREQIREGIRSGTVTEKEIRQIGGKLRERYERRLDSRAREWDQIRREQLELANAARAVKTREEAERLELRRKLLMERERCYNETYSRTAVMDQVLRGIRPIGPGGEGSMQRYSKGYTFRKEKVMEALDNVRLHLPTDWVEKGNSRPIRTRYALRGYFIDGRGEDTIALSGGKAHMECCAFHEMGHRIEYLYPEILELERQFYERRTRGEELQWLGAGYKKEEKARFDRFVNAYMGKDYGGKGYELLSMGLESLFCGTYNLSQDTEYQDFLLGILAAV